LNKREHRSMIQRKTCDSIELKLRDGGARNRGKTLPSTSHAMSNRESGGQSLAAFAILLLAVPSSLSPCLFLKGALWVVSALLCPVVALLYVTARVTLIRLCAMMVVVFRRSRYVPMILVHLVLHPRGTTTCRVVLRANCNGHKAGLISLGQLCLHAPSSLPGCRP
jgi:hypothetical protein